MLQGVAHQPYGFDDLYSTEPTERAPRDPMSGDMVLINAQTHPTEPGQTVWVTWTKNGAAQPPVGAQFQYNDASSTYWQANLGQFGRGDAVQYTVHANQNQANEQVVGPFTFNVTSWSSVTSVTSFTDQGTAVDVHTGDSAGSFNPVARFAFPSPDVFHLQFSPSGQGLSIQGLNNYTVVDTPTVLTISTAVLVLKIQKNPYRLAVYRGDGVSLITQQYDPANFHNLGWASDGKTTVTRIEDHFSISAGERFHGFGEEYDYIDHNNHDADTFIYNEYGDQAQTHRRYFAVPFFTSSAGYGVYLPSSAYSIFNLGTYLNDMAGFTLNTGGQLDATLEYYFFAGEPKTLLDRYTALTGRPQMLPKWAFGLWISANEWNSQAMVLGELNQAAQNQVPVSVLVLEQWADEATFYIWHGAQYAAKDGSAALKYADFTFPPGGEWQDPRGMVQTAHQQGVRMVLWQLPAFKEQFAAVPTPHYPAVAPQQHLNDIQYAQTQGYLVKNSAGKPYRIPSHFWFRQSQVPDFTNPAATAWWMSKRDYLVDEVGIDGFKNDYGEAVFGRGTSFADGRKGDVMHNAYPVSFIGAYNQYLHTKLGTKGALFSRAGTAGSQALSIFWAGDQLSSFDSFQAALRAGLSAGQSGVPYWSWDMAGFAGPFPSSELYLRAAAMSAFAPVMQLHSQWSAPGTSATRTPWHVQQVTGDAQVIPVFRKFANVRMNLLPYIYSEAKHSTLTGAPLMRAMDLEFPNDPGAADLDQQYMFGSQLLVAPVTSPGAATVNFYVPRGEWYDFWNSGQFAGPAAKTYGVPLDFIPVYARPGAIVPLNLNGDYQLGGVISNSTDVYTNLTFRIYPDGISTYDYYDDAVDSLATFQATAAWPARQVTVQVPKLSSGLTLQVISGLPGGVSVDGVALASINSLAGLKAAAQGWFWDPALQAALIKLPLAAAARTVVLSGVDKAAYQAEFADSNGASVNTNHANFTGLGFVDSFDQPNDSLTFNIFASSSGDYNLRFRYANALGSAATRNIYVDGSLAGTLNLPALANWDTWDFASLSTTLTLGRHQVQIKYDPGNSLPINLDSLSLSAKTSGPNSLAILTQRNDNSRTGANLLEPWLTTANVNPQGFGKLFTYPVQGFVFAQPLYLGGVTIPGKGARNVVYVATMHNQVYAFDADDPAQAAAPLWQRALEPAIALPDANIGVTYVDANHHDTGQAVDPLTHQPVYKDILQEVGILSTPVISTAHNLLYLVTASKDPAKNDASAYSHHLHALDLATGAEMLGGPLLIQASYPGAGYTGRRGEPDTVVNGQIQFVSHRQLQRSAITLANDTLYVAFASYGDKDAYHGWVLSYNAATLQPVKVFNTTPSKLVVTNVQDVGKGGIWQAGHGLAVDELNNLYLLTGNGGYQDGTDFGDCFLKLKGSDLSVLDWFTPFNQQKLAERDLDVGSAGALLLPGTNLVIAGGKESKFFLIQRDQMGHYQPAAGNSQIVQNFYIHAPENPADPIGSAAKYDGSGHHVHGGPVYWQGPMGKWIYVWVEDDVIKAFALRGDGTFATTPLTLTGIPNASLGTPVSQGNLAGLAGISGISPGMPGGMMSISANAGAVGSGIVWAAHPLANANESVAPGILRAYDASDLGQELWNSKMNGLQDEVGAYAKFCSPTVANGKVYLATFSNAVVVYGLLSKP
jgi:alpha-glucosidase (family GH31 glycosyl hydrolase)